LFTNGYDGENIMVILSSPSGVGKTTLTKKIQQKYQSFKISVSHTTRASRSNEVDGVDYHFVSHKKFEELIDQKKFYEYAKIFENYYGTLKKSVDEAILKNDIIFDIDWQGTKQLSKFKNLKLIKIYLITDNKEELKKRLVKRNQNTDEEVEKRFKSFDEDVKHWSDYDYIIINKNLDVCFKQLENIIQTNKRTYFASNNSVIL
jgi:guanylate kinase